MIECGIFRSYSVSTILTNPLISLVYFSSFFWIIIEVVGLLLIFQRMFLNDKRHLRGKNRGGSRNSDSVISGSLASPTPPEGGDTKERGDEENETESRGDL